MLYHVLIVNVRIGNKELNDEINIVIAIIIQHNIKVTMTANDTYGMDMAVNIQKCMSYLKISTKI